MGIHLLYLYDGITFISTTPTTPGSIWRGLAYNGSDRVVAIGEGYSMTSLDSGCSSSSSSSSSSSTIIPG